MGILGTITSGNCLLEGPRVGGCVLYFAANLSSGNVVSNEITQRLTVCACCFPSPWRAGCRLIVLSIAANLLTRCT